MFFTVAIIEGGVGVWLISGFSPVMAARIGAGLFLFFSFVSTIYVVIDMPECGCFGRAGVSPEWMLVLDAVACISLVVVQWQLAVQGQESLRRWRGCWIARPIVAVAVCGVVLFGVTPLGRHAGVGGPNRVEQWVGQRPALLSQTTLTRFTSQGRWLVVLYRPDCFHCQEVLRYIASVSESGRSSGRIALLNVGTDEEEPAILGSMPDCEFVYSGCVSSPGKKWVETPAIIRMDNGVVSHVWSGDDVMRLAKVMSRGTIEP